MNVDTSNFLPTCAEEAALLYLVEGLEYRDDWTLELHRSPYGVPEIMLVWSVADVRAPDQLTLLVARVAVDVKEIGSWGLRVAVEQIWQRIDDLESHERLEMFRHRGTPVWAPHPEPGSQQLVCRPYGKPAFLKDAA